MSRRTKRGLPNESESPKESTAVRRPKLIPDLSGISAVIVEVGLGKTRAAILAKQLERHGGRQHKKFESTTTHVLIDRKLKLVRVKKYLSIQEIPEGIKVIDSEWLSECLTKGKLVEVEGFVIAESATETIAGDEGKRKYESTCGTEFPKTVGLEEGGGKSNETLAGTSIAKLSRKSEVQLTGDSDSDYADSGDETDKSERSSNVSGHNSPNISPEKIQGTWMCAHSSKSQQQNHNQFITDKLQVLATSYANTKDQWRALGYKKAIASIKSYPKKLETWEECNSLPFVGERLAKKIWEIMQTGHLRRLDHVDPKQEAIDLFVGVWGAGPTTAEAWASQGFRTLEDLERHGKLTRQQKIGLKHYYEFLERMPREEAGLIEDVVKKAAFSINPALQAFACGSYRRGKPTCGDVDVIVSHPDGKSHDGVLMQLLDKLRATGFLTDDLTLADNGQHRKYLGVCKLPGDNRKHRRLDIIVVPYNEWACSLMYFTGSDYFNRSMRLLAKKKGMSLSEHSLNTGVVRKGSEKICPGTPLPVHSEKDIFDYLGLEYREPHERDW